LSMRSTLSLSTAPSPTVPYTLSLHDALPISRRRGPAHHRERHHPRTSHRRARRCGPRPDSSAPRRVRLPAVLPAPDADGGRERRSEEHTSELQSPCNLVCRLLLEKKKEVSSQ